MASSFERKKVVATPHGDDLLLGKLHIGAPGFQNDRTILQVVDAVARNALATQLHARQESMMSIKHNERESVDEQRRMETTSLLHHSHHTAHLGVVDLFMGEKRFRVDETQFRYILALGVQDA